MRERSLVVVVVQSTVANYTNFYLVVALDRSPRVSLITLKHRPAISVAAETAQLVRFYIPHSSNQIRSHNPDQIISDIIMYLVTLYTGSVPTQLCLTVSLCFLVTKILSVS